MLRRCAIEVTANDGNDAAKVAALESGESEVLTQYLSAMDRFHHYSFGNIGIGVADLGSACCRYSGTAEKTGDPGGCGCYVPVFYRIALRRGYGITSATPVPVRDEFSTPTDSVMVVRCSYCVADNEFVPMPAYKDGRSGTPCEANTRGLVQRAHVVAGEIRYVGKETDRKWEEGDEISVLDFAQLNTADQRE